MNHESLLQNLQHSIGRLRRRLLHHGLVKIRIERFALGLDARDAVPLQNVQHLVLNQRHALHQRTTLACLLGRHQRTFEVVEDRQQIQSQRPVRVTPFLGDVALGALLVIFKVGTR